MKCRGEIFGEKGGVEYVLPLLKFARTLFYLSRTPEVSRVACHEILRRSQD